MRIPSWRVSRALEDEFNFDNRNMTKMDTIEPATTRMSAEASRFRMTTEERAISADAVAFNVEKRMIAFDGPVASGASFTYESLSPDVADAARKAAVDIRELVRRQIADVIEAGRALLRVKEDLPHGAFGPWLSLEFGWTVRTAQNYMSAAERFGANAQHVSHLPVRAVYALSAPSTPDAARQALVAQVERGDRPTEVEVQQLIRVHKRAEVQARQAARAKARAARAKAAKDRLSQEEVKKQEGKEQRRLRRAEREEMWRQEERDAEISAARQAANLLLRDTPTDVIDKLAPLLRKAGAWPLMGELTKLVDERCSKLGGQTCCLTSR
jgi:hypothetical protein